MLWKLVVTARTVIVDFLVLLGPSKNRNFLWTSTVSIHVEFDSRRPFTAGLRTPELSSGLGTLLLDKCLWCRSVHVGCDIAAVPRRAVLDEDEVARLGDSAQVFRRRVH